MNLKYLETFIVSGLTVTGISYFGNSVNPALGGILSGIPISIPAMLTIASVSNQKDDFDIIERILWRLFLV